ncbi:hypothetical protein DERP_001365 [Dermatophagoides pteronyssinus]|uniref:Uncharacterized protein n=1 Tax=Dermatophagoides pteronyssinus TaxID=6956 RepID=A0ABQ8JEE6_DERPT|nr:hypothetical protein DERP_001365 [Dermatophagoides pteronyssinus]
MKSSFRTIHKVPFFFVYNIDQENSTLSGTINYLNPSFNIYYRCSAFRFVVLHFHLKFRASGPVRIFNKQLDDISTSHLILAYACHYTVRDDMICICFQ